MKRKHVHVLLKHWIVWTLAMAFWTIMREFGHQIIKEEGTVLTLIQQLRLHFVLGLIAGLIFGNLEYYLEDKIIKNKSFGKSIVIGSLTYLAVTVILISTGMLIYGKMIDVEIDWVIYKTFMFSKERALFVFYFYIVGFFIDFFKQIDKKFGPGNLWKMLKGEFHNPSEDERIFMFLDLKSSTTIAEEIGHEKYSKLIQDCFQDLNVVEEYKAEIYQYVGDEVVLSWSTKIGLNDSNCLRAFFAFKNQLLSRSSYYSDQYGLIPEFKAGLNLGKIIVAEVGEIKREIAYHGDTINTAARIQGHCNEVGKMVLISEKLEQHLSPHVGFSTAHEGEVLLKGKAKRVNIYSVEVA